MAGIPNSAAYVRDRICFKMSRSPVKEALAEFFGTFVLVVLGDGVMASCTLGRLQLNSTIIGSFGWGFSLMIAVAIAGGVSGGHVNPAVTTALASIKKCSWKQILPYVVAQYVGSFLAAAVVYFIYLDGIKLYDGGFRQIPPATNSTAQIFATYQQDFASPLTCFFDQVAGSALLLIVICAATDPKRQGVSLHSQSIIIGLGLTAIIFAFGHNCGAPLNPARDFSPRVFTALSGWGKGVFSYHNYEWFWIPVIAPHVGGLIGAWLYRILIELPSKIPRSMLERESSESLSDDERNLVEPEKLPNLSVNIPAEVEVYQHVMDKVVNDAKHDADVQTNIKQTV